MKYTYAILILLVISMIYSCTTDTVYQGKTPTISSSVDTLTFDTVFTTIGSATRSFKIYNDEDEDIYVDIDLKEGDASMFRLNIDGTPSISSKQLRIKARDSIYIFADVTVDPDKPVSQSPFIVEDMVEVVSGDTKKKVLLNAFGQNANYLTGAKRKGVVNYLSCDLGTYRFDDPKPYVIYGILLIDSCTIEIPADRHLYVHGGVVTVNDPNGIYNYSDGRILVGKNASIVARGTAEKPITIQGDRLEKEFDTRPGQWYGIRFLSESKGNVLEHVHIKNGIMACRVDSLSELTLNASKIAYSASNALVGYHANITATNTLVHHTGQETVSLNYGGNYDFNHTTIANYEGDKASLFASNFTCVPNDCAATARINPLRLSLKNTIVIGNDKDEIILDDYTQSGDDGQFDLQLSNNILRVDKLTSRPYLSDLLTAQCQNCINVVDTKSILFEDKGKGDYRLDSLSIAKDRGITSEILLDIRGISRDATPDIGCYESDY